jgi:hypothetical protein
MNEFEDTLNRAMEKAIATITGGTTTLVTPRAGGEQGNPQGTETVGEAIEAGDKEREGDGRSTAREGIGS